MSPDPASADDSPAVRAAASLAVELAADAAHLCSGEELGGVAWSHLRTAAPTVCATRVDGGWPR